MKCKARGNRFRSCTRSTATESMGPRNAAIRQAERIYLFSCFLMRRMDAAPVAELVQLDLPGNGLLVLPGMIINVLTGRAAQTGQLFFKL